MKSPVDLRVYAISLSTEDDNSEGATDMTFEVRYLRPIAIDDATDTEVPEFLNRSDLSNFKFTTAAQGTFTSNNNVSLMLKGDELTNLATIPAGVPFGLHVTLPSQQDARYVLSLKVYCYQV
jgi:hypothetical protein